MNIFLSFWRTLVWLVIMLVLFLLPADSLSKAPSFSFISEAFHVLLFGFLTLFLVWDQMRIKSQVRPSLNNYILAVILGLLLGIIIEFLQAISGFGRRAEFLDVVFDLAGCLMSVGIIVLVFSLRHSRTPKY